MAFSSGYFKTAYKDEFRLINTTYQKVVFAGFVIILAIYPFVANNVFIDLANQVFLAIIGALALMLLTGYAGQISLGHSGLLAAGAFTTGILFKEVDAPFWIAMPASMLVGAVLGLIFGFPSLRLKGLYLAITTLALHFVVVFAGGEYETLRGYSTGILVDPPELFGFGISGGVSWYFVLVIIDIIVLLFCINLLRTRTGRSFIAIRDHETVAEALGIAVGRTKLIVFVISSMMTSFAGSIFTYYYGYVTIEEFTIFVSIEYVAMVIVGGTGSLLGAILGALFVVTFPYGIEALVRVLPVSSQVATDLFPINLSAFGLIMILFLVFEPLGLVGIWRRVRDYFVLWPYRQTAVGGG